MLSHDLSKIRKEIRILEDKVKNETDHQQLWNLGRTLQDLYKKEYEIESKLKGD